MLLANQHFVDSPGQFKKFLRVLLDGGPSAQFLPLFGLLSQRVSLGEPILHEVADSDNNVQY
jgi:hypothetical protein